MSGLAEPVGTDQVYVCADCGRWIPCRRHPDAEVLPVGGPDKYGGITSRNAEMSIRANTLQLRDDMEAEPVGTDQAWLCGNCGHAFSTVPKRSDTQVILGELGVSTDYRNRTAFHGGFRPNTSMLASQEHQDRIEAGEATGPIESAAYATKAHNLSLNPAWPSNRYTEGGYTGPFRPTFRPDQANYDLIHDHVYDPADDDESDDEGNIVQGENA